MNHVMLGKDYDLIQQIFAQSKRPIFFILGACILAQIPNDVMYWRNKIFLMELTSLVERERRLVGAEGEWRGNLRSRCAPLSPLTSFYIRHFMDKQNLKFRKRTQKKWSPDESTKTHVKLVRRFLMFAQLFTTGTRANFKYIGYSKKLCTTHPRLLKGV